jgi:MYXO-CTERM domain-containing protein
MPLRIIIALAVWAVCLPAWARINLQAPNGSTFQIEDTLGGQLTGPGEFGNWPKLCVRTCDNCAADCDADQVYDAAGAASVEELNGRQRAMASRPMAGLQVQRRVYVPSAGQANANGFARYLDTLTNPTGAPITVAVRLGAAGAGSQLNNATTLWRTHSDDAELEPQDRWLVTDDNSADGGSAAVSTVVFGSGATYRPASITATLGDRAGAYSWEYRDVTVPPGQSISFVTVVIHEARRTSAIDEALNLLRARDVELLFGMDAAARNIVRNFDVSANNASPLADAGGPYTANEGQQVQLGGGSSFDPEGLPLQYAWDFDADGDFDDAQGSNAFITYPDNGIYAVSLRVTDAGGKQDIDTARITVLNVAPVIRGINTDQPIDEGGTLNVVVDAFDPGADVLTYTYDWLGDGNYEAGEDRDRHRYASDGVYNLSVRVTDDDGQTAQQIVPVTVENQPPEIFQVITNSPTLENSTVNVQVVAQDPGGDPVTYEYDLDNDGVYEHSGIGLDQVETVYPDDGLFEIHIRLTDDQGASSTRTETISIINANPRISEVNNNGPVLEGQPVAVTITATDAGADVLTYSYDFDGDGDFNDDIVDQADPTASHVYTQQGRYQVGVRVRDDDTGRALDVNEVIVRNAPPVVDVFEAANTPQQDGRYLVREGAPFTLNVLAHDPGDDVLVYSFDLTGDGNFDLINVPGHEQATSLPQQGDYTLRVRVEDGDGGTVEAEITLRVQNEIPVLELQVDSPQNEGAEVVVRAVAEDPGADVLRYSFDFDGDGIFEIEDSIEAVARHTYEDQGLYRIRAVVDDGDNRVDATANLVIDNVAPTIRISSNAPVPEGGQVELVAEISDPGPNDAITIRWDVNGEVFERDVRNDNDLRVTVNVTDDAIFNAVAVARDEDGGESEPATTQIVVTNVPPSFIEIVPLPAVEGQPYPRSLPYEDPGAQHDPPRFSLINPPAGVEIDPASGQLVWVPTYAQYLASPITIRAAVNDGDGGTDEIVLDIPVLPRDEDDDGIPDTYEDQTCAAGNDPCLDSSNAADAIEDFDGDGMTNLEEWAEGSSPFDYDGPESPVPVAPEDGDRLPTLTPTFSVETVESNLAGVPVFIEFQIHSDPELNNEVTTSEPVEQDDDEALVEWTIDDFVLLEDVTYYWRARATAGQATTEWSFPRQFRTNSVNEAPFAPVPRAPDDGVTVNITNPQLEVLPSTDPDEDELQYIFRLYRQSTGEAVQSGAGVLGDAVITFDTSTASLSEDTWYEWDVVARDRVTASEPSPRWAFFVNEGNNPPSAPRIVDPDDGGFVETLSPTIIAAGSTDSDHVDIFYRFAVRLSDAGEYLEESDDIALDAEGRGAWTPTALVEDMEHIVEVRAVDGIGESAVTQASFFVSAVDHAPPAPTPTSPTNGSTILETDGFITWTAVEDPEGADVFYNVELCDSLGNCNTFPPNVNRGQNVIDYITAGETYSWTVQAQDATNNVSGSSDAWQFTVEGGGSAEPDPEGCNCSADGDQPPSPLWAVGLLGLALLRRRR